MAERQRQSSRWKTSVRGTNQKMHSKKHSGRCRRTRPPSGKTWMPSSAVCPHQIRSHHSAPAPEFKRRNPKVGRWYLKASQILREYDDAGTARSITGQSYSATGMLEIKHHD